MAFPPGFLDELRARLSLSDVVGRKVSLKRRSGAEYAGLCPFHNEKTPSFTVNDKKGFFYCFGCHEQGDAVGFVMKTEGLSFPESVEKLAREVGLPVPRATPAERERAERVSTLQQVVEEAARWFQKQLRLPVGRQGLDYLRGRGLEDATIDDFRLGFAPDSRDGLLSRAQARGRADRQDRRGGARHPARGQQPRALRSLPRPRDVSHQRPARPRRSPSAAASWARASPSISTRPRRRCSTRAPTSTASIARGEAATKDQPVIVAEGYMDVIALHGAGFTGAVAPLGTALTEGQLGELWKLADEPYLCFDGDNAGRRAANRAAERALPLLRAGKSLRFLGAAGRRGSRQPDPRPRRRRHPPQSSTWPARCRTWSGSMETEGKPDDTPERRASLQRAIEQRVAEIADPVVRDYLPDRNAQPARPPAPAGGAALAAGRSGGPSAAPAPTRRLLPRARPPGGPEPTSTVRARNGRCWGPCSSGRRCSMSWPRTWPPCPSPAPSWPACAAAFWTPCRWSPRGSTRRPRRPWSGQGRRIRYPP